MEKNFFFFLKFYKKKKKNLVWKFLNHRVTDILNFISGNKSLIYMCYKNTPKCKQLTSE